MIGFFKRAKPDPFYRSTDGEVDLRFYSTVTWTVQGNGFVVSFHAVGMVTVVGARAPISAEQLLHLIAQWRKARA